MARVAKSDEDKELCYRSLALLFFFFFGGGEFVCFSFFVPL